MKPDHPPAADFSPDLFQPAEEPSPEPRDPWGDWGPEEPPDDIWDALKLDEETAEPDPQEGDFWGRPDEEEGV